MVGSLLNISVRYKLGVIFAILLAIFAAITFFYVTNTNAQEGDANEINQTGFLRALSIQSDLLSQTVSDVELDYLNATTAVTQEFDRTASLLAALAALFNSSVSVERSEFSLYYANLQASYPEVTLMAFIPKVPSAQRIAFEDQAQEDGLANYRIYDYDDNGQATAAALRREHFPYLFAFPENLRSDLLGFDLASDPAQLLALSQSADNATVVASGPQDSLVGERLEQKEIIIFRPIYEGGGVPTTIEERQAALRGMVAIHVDIESALRLVNQTTFSSQLLRIDDVTEGNPGQLLYEDISATVSSIPTIQVPIQVFSRQWLITLQSGENTTASLAALEDVQAGLQARITGLRDGSDNLGLASLSRYDNDEILAVFEEVQIAHAALDESLTRYLAQTNPRSRAELLPRIHQESQQLFTNANALTNMLNGEQEDNVQLARQRASIASGLTLVFAIIAFALLYYIVSSLTQVRNVADQLAKGDFTARSHLTLEDEIGQIGLYLNSMAQQIETTLTRLEQDVTTRTQDLQTVLEVSNQIATILQPTRLLQDVSDITKERFGLYHSHIYLLNPQEGLLELTAGAGHVGRQMVAEVRTIDLASPQSIVASAARTRTSINVPDVQANPSFLPHPLLPNTRSELAIPLVARGQVLGVLDVQSDEKGFFIDRTIEILEAMANQIATAISNARLFDVAERTSRHEQALGAITRKIQNASTVDQVLQVTVQELGKALRVPYTTVALQASLSSEQEE